MLIKGRVADAVIGVYTTPLGLWGSLFYALVIMIGLIMIYIKTNNFVTTGVVGLLIGALTLSYLPMEFHGVAYVLLAFGFAISFYKIMFK